MAGTPLSELETFKSIIDELDSTIRAQLSSTNNAARGDISISYTFNNDGTTTIKISTINKVFTTSTQVVGTVTTAL